MSEFTEPVAAALARFRHEIFIQRLGWPMPARDGEERDQFDRPDTIYVVALDAKGRLCGCARLLPTSRPYLLAYLLDSVFPEMVAEKPLPQAAAIWEISRFACTSPATTRRLLAATVARAAKEGAQRLITISPLGVERLLQRMGIRTARAGQPVRLARQSIFACWIEIDAQTCAALDISNAGRVGNAVTEAALP